MEHKGIEEFMVDWWQNYQDQFAGPEAGERAAEDLRAKAAQVFGAFGGKDTRGS